MKSDDNDGQMIFGDLGCLKLPDICLTGEEKLRKNITQETCPDRGSNPGPLRDRRACSRLAQSGGLCTDMGQLGHSTLWPIITIRLETQNNGVCSATGYKFSTEVNRNRGGKHGSKILCSLSFYLSRVI